MTLNSLFRAFLWLMLATGAALVWMDLGLRNEVTPQGIVSFEFCGYAGNCAEAMAAWGESGRLLMMLSLGLDYLFLFAYCGFGCTGLLLLARRVPSALQGFTGLLARISPLAGVADACENAALVKVLMADGGLEAGRIAGHFASLKFLIVGVAAVWMLVCWVVYVLLARKAS